MAKRKQSASSPIDPMEVIARLLALIAIKGVDKEEAALQLSGTGLDGKVITELLGVNESYVRIARFRRKKNAKAKSR